MDRALSGRERGRALQRRVLQRRAHYSFAPLLSFPLSLSLPLSLSFSLSFAFSFFTPTPSCLPEIKRRTSWTDIGPASAIQTLSPWLLSATFIVNAIFTACFSRYTLSLRAIRKQYSPGEYARNDTIPLRRCTKRFTNIYNNFIKKHRT